MEVRKAHQLQCCFSRGRLPGPCRRPGRRHRNDSDKLLSEAATRFSEIVGGNLDRDHIHTQRVTDFILEAFGNKKGQS
jgi:hypothetical protein